MAKPLGSGARGSQSSFKSVYTIEGEHDAQYDKEKDKKKPKDVSHLNSNEPGPKDGVDPMNLVLSPDPSGKSKDLEKGDIISLYEEPDVDVRLQRKNGLCSYIFKNVVGYDFIFKGPYGRNIATYLDYTASGRPLKCIETYIRYHVMPTYANTHTEVNFNAQQTTKFREDARQIIRKCVKASRDDCVIFTGSGSTSAINKLVHALNFKKKLNIGPTVFTGPYEHHSNIFPWKEARANVVRIRQTNEGLVDLTHLAEELVKCRFGGEKLLIGSFSAASNVTGILTDVNAIAKLMHEHNGYAFFDYACAAPYVDIEMNPKKGGLVYKDAIFISPHKFVGGPQTPGVLIAKKWVFRNEAPHNVGGGTVKFVRRDHHVYLSNPEHREEGGTPAIIETIRAGLVFKLKQTLTAKFIMDREDEMLRRALEIWGENQNLIILGSLTVHRLPIFPLIFADHQTGRLLHHDFVAMILNDVFGIQVRSGCACAAPYVLDLLGMEEKMAEKYEKLIAIDTDTKTKRKSEYSTAEGEDYTPVKEDVDNVIFKPGFVRLNFPFFISEACFVFVVKAIMMTAEKGWTLLPWYDFDKRTGKWTFTENSGFHAHKSLKDVTFDKGKLEIKKQPNRETGKKQRASIFSALQVSVTSSPTATLSTLSSSHEGFNYFEILERADIIFQQAETAETFDNVIDKTKEFTEEEEELRWFMLPIEAANLLLKKEVKVVQKEDFPFHPGTKPKTLFREKDNRSFLIPYLFLLAIVLVILLVVLGIMIHRFINDRGDAADGNGTAAGNETLNNSSTAFPISGLKVTNASV